MNSIKQHPLAYLNTALITLICGFAMMIFIKINGLVSRQDQINQELIRIKTIQDINTTRIATQDERISVLEKKNNLELMQWVENNFIRKK